MVNHVRGHLYLIISSLFCPVEIVETLKDPVTCMYLLRILILIRWIVLSVSSKVLHEPPRPYKFSVKSSVPVGRIVKTGTRSGERRQRQTVSKFLLKSKVCFLITTLQPLYVYL